MILCEGLKIVPHNCNISFCYIETSIQPTKILTGDISHL